MPHPVPSSLLANGSTTRPLSPSSQCASSTRITSGACARRTWASAAANRASVSGARWSGGTALTRATRSSSTSRAEVGPAGPVGGSGTDGRQVRRR